MFMDLFTVFVKSTPLMPIGIKRLEICDCGESVGIFDFVAVIVHSGLTGR